MKLFLLGMFLATLVGSIYSQKIYSIKHFDENYRGNDCENLKSTEKEAYRICSVDGEPIKTTTNLRAIRIRKITDTLNFVYQSNFQKEFKEKNQLLNIASEEYCCEKKWYSFLNNKGEIESVQYVILDSDKPDFEVPIMNNLYEGLAKIYTMKEGLTATVNFKNGILDGEMFIKIEDGTTILNFDKGELKGVSMKFGNDIDILNQIKVENGEYKEGSIYVDGKKYDHSPEIISFWKELIKRYQFN